MHRCLALCLSDHYITVPEVVTLRPTKFHHYLPSYLLSLLPMYHAQLFLDVSSCLRPHGLAHGVQKAQILAWVCHFLLQEFSWPGSIPSPASAGRILYLKSPGEPLRPTCNILTTTAFRMYWKYNFVCYLDLGINFKAQLLRLIRRKSIILHSNLVLLTYFFQLLIYAKLRIATYFGYISNC